MFFSAMAQEASKKTYTLAELAALSGVSERTIRYYISLGLVPEPIGQKRWSHYEDAHLSSLLGIQEKVAEGMSLAQIRAGPATLGVSYPMVMHQITQDVQVLVRADLPPARVVQIETALAAFGAALNGKDHT